MRYARLGLVLGALLLSSACAGQRIASAPAGPATVPSGGPSPGPSGPPAPRPAVPAPRTSPAAPPVGLGYEETGEASWYGNPYHGRRAASGEIYDMHQMTAAHRTLPFDTRVRVENLVDGSGVELRINDRGPFKDPERRIIDVSYAAARLLGMVGPGIIPVRLRVVGLPGATRAAPPSVPPLTSSPPTVPVVAATSEASPPLSPPATPVAGADASSPVENHAPREAVASPREVDAAPRAGWTLQLAAYSSEGPAVDRARAWPGAQVQKGDAGGRTVWRVRVGRYPTRREAEEAAQRMTAAGHRVLVVEAATP